MADTSDTGSRSEFMAMLQQHKVESEQRPVARWNGRPQRRIPRPITPVRQLATAVERDPRTLGQPVDVWTSAQLSAYLAETTGTRIAPGWLRVLLHRQRFANGRPKHSVAQLQDPVEVAACVACLRAVGEKVRANPDRYELHYEDETHVETNPYLGRVWHRVGQQPVVPAAGAYRLPLIPTNIPNAPNGPDSFPIDARKHDGQGVREPRSTANTPSNTAAASGSAGSGPCSAPLTAESQQWRGSLPTRRAVSGVSGGEGPVDSLPATCQMPDTCARMRRCRAWFGWDCVANLGSGPDTGSPLATRLHVEARGHALGSLETPWIN